MSINLIPQSLASGAWCWLREFPRRQGIGGPASRRVRVVPVVLVVLLLLGMAGVAVGWLPREPDAAGSAPAQEIALRAERPAAAALPAASEGARPEVPCSSRPARHAAWGSLHAVWDTVPPVVRLHRLTLQGDGLRVEARVEGPEDGQREGAREGEREGQPADPGTGPMVALRWAAAVGASVQRLRKEPTELGMGHRGDAPSRSLPWHAELWWPAEGTGHIAGPSGRAAASTASLDSVPAGPGVAPAVSVDPRDGRANAAWQRLVHQAGRCLVAATWAVERPGVGQLIWVGSAGVLQTELPALIPSDPEWALAHGVWHALDDDTLKPDPACAGDASPLLVVRSQWRWAPPANPDAAVDCGARPVAAAAPSEAPAGTPPATALHANARNLPRWVVPVASPKGTTDVAAPSVPRASGPEGFGWMALGGVEWRWSAEQRFAEERPAELLPGYHPPGPSRQPSLATDAIP